jgi:hypothetical protein
VLRAPVDLSGYALLAGRSGGQTLYGGTGANEDITIHGTSDATRTTSYVILQPTAGNVGIRTSAPGYALEVAGIVASGSASAGGEFRSYQSPISNKNCIGLGTNDSENRSGLARYLNDTSIGYFLFYDTSTGDTSLNVVFTGAAITMKVANVEKARLSNAGNFGIGTTAPATRLHALTTDTATNAVTNIATLGHNTSNTPAAGFGGGLAFNLQSSTTASQSAACIQALWNDATHASRKADLVLTAYDSGGEREGLRIRGDGSGPALGFFGTAPAARPTGVAVSAAGIHAALVTLGLITA